MSQNHRIVEDDRNVEYINTRYKALLAENQNLQLALQKCKSKKQKLKEKLSQVAELSEIGKLTAKYEAKSEKHKAKLKAFREECESKVKAMAEERSRSLDKHKAKVKEIREERESRVDTITKECDSKVKVMMEKLKKNKDKFENKVKEIRGECDSRLNAITKECEFKLNKYQDYDTLVKSKMESHNRNLELMKLCMELKEKLSLAQMDVIQKETKLEATKETNTALLAKHHAVLSERELERMLQDEKDIFITPNEQVSNRVVESGVFRKE